MNKIWLQDVVCEGNGGDGIRIEGAGHEIHGSRITSRNNKGSGIVLAATPVLSEMGLPAETTVGVLLEALKRIVELQPERREQVIQDEGWVSRIWGAVTDGADLASNLITIANDPRVHMWIDKLSACIGG